jgi:hypothetical protein
VPLEGERPREEQDGKEAGEEQVRVDVLPEPRPGGEQRPLVGESLEGDAEEDAPDLCEGERVFFRFFLVVGEREGGGGERVRSVGEER